MKTQRRIFFSLLLVILALFVSACTNTNAPVEDTTDPVVTEPIVQDLTIVANSATEYSIVIPEKADDAVEDVSRTVMNTIQSVTGVKPEWTDDYMERGSAPKAKEILIGLTNRAESTQVLEDLAYGEYAIRIVDERIVIAAWDGESLRKACSVFVNQIKRLGETGQFILPHDYSAQGTGISQIVELPRYGEMDEKIQFVDLADKCYMLHVGDTDKTEYIAYLDALKKAGYKEFASRQMGENLFATYTSDTKVIHTSYFAKRRDAHITIEDAYDMTIFTEQAYEKVCEPAVSLVGQEVYTGSAWIYNALCMVFRLEDGRFVIVDSGYAAFSVQMLDKTLRSLHVTDGDMTIAAWIFTHPHSDHTGGFQSLSGSSLKNRIVVENFVHHFASGAQHKASGDSDSADSTRATMRGYRGANIIKAHTGQVIRVGGLEIEMLYTFADLEPEALDEINTTSLVFRVTAQDNSVMALGDASNRVCNHLISSYGDYMKSDMVQIAHHGYNGVAGLYELIDADVVLWPGGVNQFYGRHDGTTQLYRLMDWDFNKRALELAEECYVAGDSIHTLTLPYTPPDNDVLEIYDGENE